MTGRLLIILITAIEVVVGAMFFQQFYGWIDDVSSMLQFKGAVLNVPTVNYLHLIHNYTAYVFVELYRNFPGIDWYGIFLSGGMFVATLLINNILSYLFDLKKPFGILGFFVFSLFFFIAFVVEHIQILNFTRLALLLSGASFLSLILLISSQKLNTKTLKFKAAVFLFLYLLGFNIRPTVGIFAIPVILGISMLLLKTTKRRIGLIAACMLFLGVFAVQSWITLTDAEKEHMVYEKKILNILDGFNRLPYHTITDPVLKAKAYAIYNWYLADQYILRDPALLDTLTTSTALSLRTLKHWRNSLGEEIYKAQNYYTHNYHQELNWLDKSVFMFGFILLLPCLFLVYNKPGSGGLWALLGMVALCIFYLLLITVLIKMEDRLLGPLLVILVLGCLVVARRHVSPGGTIPLMLITMYLFFFSITRVYGFWEIRIQKEDEIARKKAVIEELKTKFHDKIIFFDIYSVSILHDRPFIDAPVNEPSWIAYLEIWNMRSEGQKALIKRAAGCVEPTCFYRRICENPDSFIFFMSGERAAMLEYYFSTIYGMDLRWENITEGTALCNLDYSFMWEPLNLGYFRAVPGCFGTEIKDSTNAETAAPDTLAP